MGTILRQRQAAQVDSIDSRPTNDASTTSILIKTVAVTTYPTAAKVFYGVQSVDPTGVESEGSTATFANPSGTFYALNIGNTVIPVGTAAVAAYIGGRWIIRY